ncbi:hypothetical protein HK100_011669 [Physocladia obscura]|uniref:N-acetyltransferase domain-containing protein n=1 Tax=Physocladia obscura TaxID=109957 RepID=A0AAD5XKN6_9FUNG|nr:hypothetical protein HK100_011669 [Physocladia obscura]
MKNVSYSLTSAACFRQDAMLVDKMLATRRLSALSGPANAQNPRANYLPIRNSLYVTAWRKEELVGYILARSFQTSSVLGQKIYHAFDTSANEVNDDHATVSHLADTLTINEIVVQQSVEGKGIASKMLDVIMSQNSQRALSDVEFSVLCSNSSSEKMFTRFAERHGHAISFGNVSGSAWGSYIDWKVSVQAVGKVRSLCKENGSGNKLTILSPPFHTLSSLASTDWQCFRDRRDLVDRSRSFQKK